MKSLRLFSLAALMVSMVFPLSSQAQRGMGGGGARGGMGGGARVAGGARFGGAPMGARGGVIAGPRGRVVARPSASIGTARFHVVGFRNSGHFRGLSPNNCVAGFPCSPIFFRNCFGFGCRNHFFFNSGFFPFGGFGFGGLGFGGFGGWGYPYDSSLYDNYAQAPPAQPAVSSDNGNGANLELAMEVQRLSDKIDELHAQERQGAAARPPQAQGSISAQAPADSTAFVFRDGHRITTQNFAIVGDTLWVLGEHTAKKVSLANLDKAATEQANAANGIELHLP